MLHWLTSNLSTIVISLLLLAVIFLIIRYLIRQSKQGKHSCGDILPAVFRLSCRIPVLALVTLEC